MTSNIQMYLGRRPNWWCPKLKTRREVEIYFRNRNYRFFFPNYFQHRFCTLHLRWIRSSGFCATLKLPKSRHVLKKFVSISAREKNERKKKVRPRKRRRIKWRVKHNAKVFIFVVLLSSDNSSHQMMITIFTLSIGCGGNIEQTHPRAHTHTHTSHRRTYHEEWVPCSTYTRHSGTHSHHRTQE